MPALPARPDARRHAAVLLTAFGLAACQGSTPTSSVPAPPAGFAFASAAPDCAPWDGAAVTILLSDRPAADSAGIPDSVRPLLRISLYPRDAGVTGRTYRWPAETEMASGVRCLAEGPCEAATDGEVKLLPGPADTTLSGSLRLHFSDGSIIAGGFHAAWHARRMMCG